MRYRERGATGMKVSVLFAVAFIAAISPAACTSLIGANFDRTARADGAPDDNDGAPNANDDGAASEDGSKSQSDGSSLSDGSPQGPIDAGSYAAAQAALQKLRYPGPLTAQGSVGYCTDSHFVWRESDGTLHSWAAADQSKIDYAFKQPVTPIFFPGDVYLPVNKSDYSVLQVFDTNAANTMVTTLPYAYNTAGMSDGVLLLEQTGTVPNQVTKVQKWTAGTGMTTDVLAATVPTPQPPLSFGLNQAVIPASVNAPYPLYIVDVAAKTTTSVTFDGGIAIYQTASTPLGLIVSYARSGPIPEIRLYQNNQDATRVEIGDDVANIPPLYSDSPANEHKFIAHITIDGHNLIYGSAFGTFGFNLDNSTLFPVQLSPTKTTFVTDVLCVIPSARLLMYRVQGDAAGQIWALPLASVLP